MLRACSVIRPRYACGSCYLGCIDTLPLTCMESRPRVSSGSARNFAYKNTDKVVLLDEVPSDGMDGAILEMH